MPSITSSTVTSRTVRIHFTPDDQPERGFVDKWVITEVEITYTNRDEAVYWDLSAVYRWKTKNWRPHDASSFTERYAGEAWLKDLINANAPEGFQWHSPLD